MLKTNKLDSRATHENDKIIKILRHCAPAQKRHAVLDTASQKQETFACTRLDCHATNVARSDAIFTVMLNLFQHLTSLQYSFQAYEILKLSWIIRVLAGVTFRSNLRARLRRRPTENPQVQDDNLTKEGLLCFP